MPLPRRRRIRIALTVVLCLLFQQVALAAYACTLVRMPAETVAMTQACTGMGAEQARESPALCEQHCAPDRSVTAGHAAPGIAPLLLAPLMYGSVLPGSMTHVALLADAPIDRSDPPPRLRYCSLLI